MGIYVWGSGCGASELLEQGFELDRVEAFVDSFPMGDSFLEKRCCCRNSCRSMTVTC